MIYDGEYLSKFICYLYIFLTEVTFFSLLPIFNLAFNFLIVEFLELFVHLESNLSMHVCFVCIFFLVMFYLK